MIHLTVSVIIAVLSIPVNIFRKIQTNPSLIGCLRHRKTGMPFSLGHPGFQALQAAFTPAAYSFFLYSWAVMKVSIPISFSFSLRRSSSRLFPWTNSTL